MADLQGPKIRVGKFEGGKTMLEAGAEVRPRRRAAPSSATSERVGLDYKELPRDVRPGDTLLLNDGLLAPDRRRGARRGGAHHASSSAASCRTTRASTRPAAASPRRR